MCALNSSEQLTLVLASSSPRRRELLKLLGLPFVVQPVDVAEANHVGESPAEMVLRLSQDKARAALVQAPGRVIVAADTSVALEGKALGKPVDAADAVRTLRALRGRRHTVFSGLTVIAAQFGWQRTVLAESMVWMRHYSDAEVDAYVASGDPLDKAGAYAIQYLDFAPVARIDGCYTNVMGLPLCHLYCLLREIGMAPAETPVAACNHTNQRVCTVAKEILAGSAYQAGLLAIKQ
jgi:MAF protein